MRFSFALCFSTATFLFRILRGRCAEIIGGKESVPHSKPFMALIQGSQYCGGTLIKPNWVLTAAHCKLGTNPTVMLGAHSITKDESTKQIFRVTKRLPHPCYSSEMNGNDLMLLQLNETAKIGQAVNTIRLPSTYNDLREGTQCLVAGWGITHNGEKKPSDVLREVSISVIKRSICNDKKHYNSDPPVTLNMMCAGDKKGKKDSCTGDSGGPLICNGEQRGIVSFGKKCGDPRHPGVYTRLTKNYISWIRKTINGDL
ncbi:granzyme A-like [Hemicordylus capensis]|uniref:granzyme A-like n=1 Tax=Hemicordylus capensis TaxID=884348 RepID=UPI00230473D3|nr:granzyme A-like [Hemicordylus capensis]